MTIKAIQVDRLIDTVLTAVNADPHLPISTAMDAVWDIANILVNAGCIERTDKNQFVRRADYTDPSKCTECGRHSSQGESGACWNCVQYPDDEFRTNCGDCKGCDGSALGNECGG